jgi:succinylarginine dihydrolase
LRVVADLETIDPRFIVNFDKLKLCESVIGRTWPEQIDPGDLGKVALQDQCRSARAELLAGLGFSRGEL